MARTNKTVEPLPTIAEVDDEPWSTIRAFRDELDPPAGAGRPRTDPRQARNGITYQMRGGVPWNQLPKPFGDDSRVHRTMQRRIVKGVFGRAWAVLLGNCEELGGIGWQWRSADGAMGNARFGGTASGRTPRIAGRTARNGARFSRLTAGRWASSSPAPPRMTPSC